MTGGVANTDRCTDRSAPAESRRLRHLSCGLAVVLFAGAALRIDAAQPPLALVIGNGNYRHVVSLRNPPHDARLVAHTLQSLGFELIGDRAIVDADRAGMERAIRYFGRRLHLGGTGLFYYAGHGVQIAKENYLVPVGADAKTAVDAKWELISVNYVLDEMRGARNRLNIMILDACRNNPFGGSVSGSDGLTEMLPENGVIMYSAAAGHTAVDGSGTNSPFTVAVAAAMMTPGLDVIDAFNKVRVTVRSATAGQQVPFLAASLIDNFQFRPMVPRAKLVH